MRETCSKGLGQRQQEAASQATLAEGGLKEVPSRQFPLVSLWVAASPLRLLLQRRSRTEAQRQPLKPRSRMAASSRSSCL